MKPLQLVLVLALTATSAIAAERKITASNHVVVGVDGDDFKPSTDFSAPIIRDGKAGGGYLYFLRRIRGAGDVLIVQGQTSYLGDWRRYDRAYLKGGEAVEFKSLAREVGYCSGSRTCRLQESYELILTPDQVSRAISAGGLVAQVGSPVGEEFLVNVPAAHMQAVAEVAAAPK